MVAHLQFSPLGPFDAEEQEVIREVVALVSASQSPAASPLLAAVTRSVAQLDRQGELLCDYPSLFAEQVLGSQRRDLASLVELLCCSTPSNFDMFLPGRALVSRSLVMGEVNFYRLLRMVCVQTLPEEQLAEVKPQVDRRLCHCLYARLAETVLISLATDRTIARLFRDRAVLSLSQLWEQVTYRVSDFFPLLEATWEARRRVPVTLGTLMGATEMFRLIEAGCDPAFVDYLVRPDHTDDEAAAFREFLFGTTTEQLERIEQELVDEGGVVVARQPGDCVRDACGFDGDPALALFEFFLSRHLQASARRQAATRGPKRTAEEYVMLHYLENMVDSERLSLPPPAFP